MSIQGKGFFIWKIPNAENGNPATIANIASAVGITHVLLKIADGPFPNNVDQRTREDLVPPVVQALRSRGITVWGWHYVYGNDPIGEANIAIRRIHQCDVEGYVINAEVEYKEPGKSTAAKRYTDRLRQEFPSLPIALSSYRFPSFHPQLPWKSFLEKIDLNMPQVYWEKAHNPGAQLRRCVREFQSMTPFRPVFPTGPSYKWDGWRPTPAGITEFLDTAQALKLDGANFFSWESCRRDLPEIWTAITTYPWAPVQPLQDIADRFIAELNSRDPARITALYHPDAVHVTFARAIHGSVAIRAWYNTLITQVLPNPTFKLTRAAGDGGSRQINWTAQSSKGSVQNGNDTLGIMDGKIAYHYSSFNIAS